MKKRLDVLLLDKGIVPSREKAQGYIMAGDVYVNNQKELKPGQQFDENDVIELRGEPLPYVSRGGFKLKKAVESFFITLNGKTAMDIGASTGGFTDCMLKEGAKKVYSVDVGYGQLDWSLRSDERVVVLERTNARYLTPTGSIDPLDFISIDVSFISLEKILPAAYSLLKQGGEVVALIKPQFEAGREKIGKHGVVKSKTVHADIINKLVNYASIQFRICGIDFSPIKGPKGNIEYLLYLKKDVPCTQSGFNAEDIVSLAHKTLESCDNDD